MRSAALTRRGREAKSWLMDACFPLWAETGFDGALFRETLDMQHRPKHDQTHRVRVQGRQTYIFAMAARLGWNPNRAIDRVRSGIDLMSGPGRRSDGLIGRTLNESGTGLEDDTADLYDTAFVLVALAEAAQIINDSVRPLDIANEILTSLDELMKDETRGGYAEWLPAPDSRLQNPHMHLFEACIGLHQADPDSGHLERAGEILSLFQTRLKANAAGLVAEVFQRDWSLEAGAKADIFEPGHQFEWVWLLTQHAKLIDAYPPPEAQTLYDYAVSTCDTAGRVPQSATCKGEPVDASLRTWPQTEALKAHLSMLETHSDSVYCDRVIQSFDILMDEHLTPEGGWIDHYDVDGLPLSTSIPASSGYHVALALSELIRVTGA